MHGRLAVADLMPTRQLRSTLQVNGEKMEYKLFENPFLERIHPIGNGFQKIYKFDNGYGASIVRFRMFKTYGSYTDNEDEFELAVIKFKGKGWDIDYGTPITNDVLGHLTKDEVEETLEKIRKL